MNTHHLEEEKMQTKHKKRTRKIQAQLLEQVTKRLVIGSITLLLCIGSDINNKFKMSR